MELVNSAEVSQVTAPNVAEPMASSSVDQILQGRADDALLRLPDSCVDTIVTSPPYYAQRDYEVSGQLGAEATPEEYIQKLVSIFEQAKRVLREDGTLWLNLGDKYGVRGLLGLPWRVAFSLQSAGWLLRSDIIWYKPNAMPAPVRNRPTTDHEYIFLFAKSEKYYYDADAIREPHKTFSENSRMRGGRKHLQPGGITPEKGKNGGKNNLHSGAWDKAFHRLGRNKRTVWEVPLSKCRDAHFAVFPEKLIEPCILAGCRPGGTVLDPFLGTGTTAVVAARNSRHFIGIELNERYCEFARRRLRLENQVLF